MNGMMLRTVQIGVALCVLTLLSVGTLVILGLMSQDTALRVGINITAIVVMCMLAGLVLTALFAVKRKSDDAS
jgi:hypothetical protein